MSIHAVGDQTIQIGRSQLGLTAHIARIPPHTTSPVHFAIRRVRDGGSERRMAIFYRGSGAMGQNPRTPRP